MELESSISVCVGCVCGLLNARGENDSFSLQVDLPGIYGKDWARRIFDPGGRQGCHVISCGTVLGQSQTQSATAQQQGEVCEAHKPSVEHRPWGVRSTGT